MGIVGPETVRGQIGLGDIGVATSCGGGMFYRHCAVRGGMWLGWFWHESYWICITKGHWVVGWSRGVKFLSAGTGVGRVNWNIGRDSDLPGPGAGGITLSNGGWFIGACPTGSWSPGWFWFQPGDTINITIPNSRYQFRCGYIVFLDSECFWLFAFGRLFRSFCLHGVTGYMIRTQRVSFTLGRHFHGPLKLITGRYCQM